MLKIKEEKKQAALKAKEVKKAGLKSQVEKIQAAKSSPKVEQVQPKIFEEMLNTPQVTEITPPIIVNTPIKSVQLSAIEVEKIATQLISGPKTRRQINLAKVGELVDLTVSPVLCLSPNKIKLLEHKINSKKFVVKRLAKK